MRSALETGTVAAAALGWQQAQQEEHDDCPGQQQQDSQQHQQAPPHRHEAAAALHTHTLGQNGSISSGSWHASVDGGGTTLASLDTLPGAAAVPPYHQPTSVSHATLSCSMQHPGSICCSKLSSAMDPGGAACTVSLHTTARWVASGAVVVGCAASMAQAAAQWSGVLVDWQGLAGVRGLGPPGKASWIVLSMLAAVNAPCTGH